MEAAPAEAEAADQRRKAEKAEAEVAAVDARWQAFNDTNLAEAVRQKKAAEWKAALNEAAYDEVYSTARESMDKAGRILQVTTVEGAKLIRKAGEAADGLLASKNLFRSDRLDDLGAVISLRHTRDESEYLAKLASKTQPFAKRIQKLRRIDEQRRAQRYEAHAVCGDPQCACAGVEERWE